MAELSNKVSIIIPCYNYAKYLGECLDSIMKQTYQNIEVIVVNDGGKDDVKSVTDKYPVRLIEKENGGLSSARNAGIAKSSGRYIMCLDADDKLTPGAIAEHVRLMTDDKSIGLCALMEFGDRYTVSVPTIVPTLDRTLRGNTIYCNAMYPRQAWVDVGGYDESEIMRLGYEDWEFWIRCLALGYHVNLSNFIALRYRCHQGQMTQATSHPNDTKLRDYLKIKHKELYEKYNFR